MKKKQKKQKEQRKRSFQDLSRNCDSFLSLITFLQVV